jgi:signal peptidase I
MEPAIHAGDVLVVGKLWYGFRPPWSDSYLLRWADPAINDVVVFLTPHGIRAVKRCVSVTGKGEFIAQGDNSSVSLDSGYYGPVPIDSIIGQALWIK